MRPETNLDEIRLNTLAALAASIEHEPEYKDEAPTYLDYVPLYGFIFSSERGDFSGQYVQLICDSKLQPFDPQYDLDGPHTIRFHDEKAIEKLPQIFGFRPSSAKVIKGKLAGGRKFSGHDEFTLEWKFLAVSEADYAEAQRRRQLLVKMSQHYECALAAGNDQIFYAEPDK